MFETIRVGLVGFSFSVSLYNEGVKKQFLHCADIIRGCDDGQVSVPLGREWRCTQTTSQVVRGPGPGVLSAGWAISAALL